jgi:hypothetical protein
VKNKDQKSRIQELLRKNALDELKDYLVNLEDQNAFRESNKELWSKAVEAIKTYQVETVRKLVKNKSMHELAMFGIELKIYGNVWSHTEHEAFKWIIKDSQKVKQTMEVKDDDDGPDSEKSEQKEDIEEEMGDSIEQIKKFGYWNKIVKHRISYCGTSFYDVTRWAFDSSGGEPYIQYKAKMAESKLGHRDISEIQKRFDTKKDSQQIKHMMEVKDVNNEPGSEKSEHIEVIVEEMVCQTNYIERYGYWNEIVKH